MKKLIFFAAAATLFIVSCNKENPAPKGQNLVFKASIENADAKATLGEDLSVNWTKGDKIGIWVADAGWTTKNQPFTLVGDGGSAQGEFQYDHGDFDATEPKYAFFPWQGNSSDDNNVYEETLYFKMKGGAYYDYVSGQLLTPLVAALAENDPTDIHFKFVGGAVKVSVKGVPGSVHSIGMTIPGFNIHEDFSVNPEEAGTCSVAATEGENSSVWLNFATAEEARDFDFVFPVPTVAAEKILFEMWDADNICVWSGKAKNATIGRGEALVMPELTFSYKYPKFTEASANDICGSFTNNWSEGLALLTDGNWDLAKNVEIPAGGEFKVRINGSWDEAYPGSNYVVNEEGTYNILYNRSSHEIKLIKL